ncbi:hypothetical protein THAOC_35190, partial [Thalassiosira oceanica]
SLSGLSVRKGTPTRVRSSGGGASLSSAADDSQVELRKSLVLDTAGP